MDRDIVQRYWDESLIKHHRLYGSMGDVMESFLGKVGSGHLMESDDIDWDIVYSFISDFKLKRCRDRQNNGALRLSVRARTYVSVFIGQRCVLLNECLFSKKNSELDILNSINEFKWIRKTANDWKKLAKKARDKKKEEAFVVIKARELSKKHDWGTVK